jgi:hypothetical protein
MKWPLVGVAFILGVAITWFVTVKRVTLVVPAEGQVSGGAGAAEDDGEAEDDASGFGGAHTPVSDTPGAAEAWDRDAEDEDALLSGRTDEVDGDVAVRAEVPKVERADEGSDDVSMPPVADATPNGDLAGVGDPDVVAAVEEEVEQHYETPKAP